MTLFSIFLFSYPHFFLLLILNIFKFDSWISTWEDFWACIKPHWSQQMSLDIVDSVYIKLLFGLVSWSKYQYFQICMSRAGNLYTSGTISRRTNNKTHPGKLMRNSNHFEKSGHYVSVWAPVKTKLEYCRSFWCLHFRREIDRLKRHHRTTPNLNWGRNAIRHN